MNRYNALRNRVPGGSVFFYLFLKKIKSKALSLIINLIFSKRLHLNAHLLRSLLTLKKNKKL